MNNLVKDGQHPISPQGFTLIEVLVALALIGLGLLGISALQLESMRANQGAYQRTQAIIALLDMAERLRMAPEAFVAADARPFDSQALLDDWHAELQRLPASVGASAPEGSLDCSDSACGDGQCRLSLRWREVAFGTADPSPLALCVGLP